MEITVKEKNAISERLRAYVAKYPSQTKAAGSLKGQRGYREQYPERPFREHQR